MGAFYYWRPEGRPAVAQKIGKFNNIYNNSSYEWAAKVYPRLPQHLWDYSYTEAVRIGNHPNMVFQTCFNNPASDKNFWWHEKTSTVRTKSGGCFPIAYQDGAAVIERVSPNGWYTGYSIQTKKLYLGWQQSLNYYLWRRDNNDRAWR